MFYSLSKRIKCKNISKRKLIFDFFNVDFPIIFKQEKKNDHCFIAKERVQLCFLYLLFQFTCKLRQFYFECLNFNKFLNFIQQ